MSTKSSKTHTPTRSKSQVELADDGKSRCDWAIGKSVDLAYRRYHDEEWGVPVHDDQRLFEFIVLEGAQAGLSWRTVLGKRDAYRRAFHGFEIAKVAAMSDAQLEKLLLDPGLIRNRLKIFSARNNARAVLAIIEEFGSLDAWLWSFVDGKPLLNQWTSQAEVPATSGISDALSKALHKRGLRFVGSTIIYAFMQATGMVNDHLTTCFCHPLNHKGKSLA
ncbi:MAG TPA: DNA-3-methyladenine glycosylase I [Dokdonella sp.]|uniref:DNA-3-methyladenine glycosylase I n=1 Tax=Dokdonella sp. TaxID=2291710 RepID=UPI002D7EC0D6|nr:DNA-3-methyladenine glycosylase I [Dokdonella sp.]HET9032951.1 DNA-3-methyladenine glycosylase I [Dokdonella sp.]